MEAPEQKSEKASQRDIFIVVLGSGLEKRSGEILPNLGEKARIIAGLEVVDEKNAQHIVFTGGDVYQIGTPISEFSAKYFQKQYLHRHLSSQEIDISTVSAKNTIDEFERIKKLREINPNSQIFVVSNEFHKVAQELCKKDNFEFVSAEKELKERYGKASAERIDEIVASRGYQELIQRQNGIVKILNRPFGELIYKIIADYTLKNRAVLK